MRENTIRPQAHPRVPGSGRSPSERQTWFVLLCSAAALTGVVLVSIPLVSAIDATAMLTVSGVIAVVLVMLSGVAGLRRSRTRHTPEDTVGVTEDVAEDAPEKVAEGIADEAPEQLTTRVLRLQVSTLESALEELQQLRLDDVRCADERQSEDSPAVSRERALVTVRALRDTLADQPGFAAVDRIEAALTRIGVEVSFERPTLTSMPVAVPFVTIGSSVQVVVAERTPVTEAVTEAVILKAPIALAPIEEAAAEESLVALALIEEAVLAVTPVAVAAVVPVVLPVPVAVVEAPIEESLPVSFAEPEPEPVPVSSVESETAPVPDVPAPVATVVLPVPAPPPVAVEPPSRRRRLRRSVAA